MKVHTFPQLSPEWFEIRKGIPTASEFGSILTPKTMKLAAAAHGYICRLIGELHDPYFAEREQATSPAMRHGIKTEPEARAYYELERGVDVHQVGFCLTDDGRVGCSPDALVGEDGVLELKCPSPHTHVGYLLNCGGEVPDEYRGQVHGHLLVTGRAWCDFLSYCPPLPPYLVRVEPNQYTEALRNALVEFLRQFDEALAKIRNYDLPKPAIADVLRQSIMEVQGQC